MEQIIAFVNEADKFEDSMSGMSSSKLDTKNIQRLTHNIKNRTDILTAAKKDVKDSYNKLRAYLHTISVETESFHGLIKFAKKRMLDVGTVSRHFEKHCKRLSEYQKFLHKCETLKRKIRKYQTWETFILARIPNFKHDILDVVSKRLEGLEGFDEEVSRLHKEAKHIFPYEERWKLNSNKTYSVTDNLSNKPVGNLFDISDSKLWKVKSPTGEKLILKSICLTLLPRNEEALKQVNELKIFLQNVRCKLLELKLKDIYEQSEEIAELHSLKAEVLESEAEELLKEHRYCDASLKLRDAAELQIKANEEKRGKDNIAKAIKIETHEKFIDGEITPSRTLEMFKIAEDIAQSTHIKLSVQNKIFCLLKQKADLFCCNVAKNDTKIDTAKREALEALEECLAYAEKHNLDEDERLRIIRKMTLLQNQDDEDEFRKDIEDLIANMIEAIIRLCDDGQVNEAIENFKLLLTLKLKEPKISEAFVKICKTFLQKGNKEEARKAFKENHKHCDLLIEDKNQQSFNAEMNKLCNDYNFRGKYEKCLFNFNQYTQSNEFALSVSLIIVLVVVMVNAYPTEKRNN